MNLETNRGIYYCATRKHYFDHPDHVTDRLKVYPNLVSPIVDR